MALLGAALLGTVDRPRYLGGVRYLSVDWIDAVADALREASLPPRFLVRGYRISNSEALGLVIQVALILGSDDWDNEQGAHEREAAREAVGMAVLPFEMAVHTSFRTTAEHERFQTVESGAWTAVGYDGPV